MIYIHTYGIGKFGNTERKTVHDTLESANASVAVLGGVAQAFESVENVGMMAEVLRSEVAEIIDDFSTRAPGSAGSFQEGSTEWDLRKVRAINMINQIIDGDY